MLALLKLDEVPSSAPFLVRAPVPCSGPDLDKSWAIDGRAVQRDAIARDSKGKPTAMMVTALVDDVRRAYRLEASDEVTESTDSTPGGVSDAVINLGLETTPNGVRGTVGCELFGEFMYAAEAGPLLSTEAYFSTIMVNEHVILGVWSFLTVRADTQAIELTIEVSNACMNPDGSGFSGALYFDGLKFTGLGDGWTIVPVVERAGQEGEWLLKPLDDGDHWMGPRHHFHRRFVICPREEVGRAQEIARGVGRAIADGPCSYYEKGWGPQQMPLPRLGRAYRHWDSEHEYHGRAAARSRFGGQVESLKAILASGVDPHQNFNMHTPVLGWAHPMGCSHGYEHGGWWIYPCPGWSQTPEQNYLLMLFLQCHAERDVMWAMDPQTGMPLDQTVFHEQYPEQIPFLVALTGASQLQIPGFDEDKGFPWNEGDCPYRDMLKPYRMVDSQHGVRGTLNAKTLVWNWNDAYAKHHLHQWTSHFILGKTIHRHHPWGFGDHLESNYQLLPFVRANRYRGVVGGREHAWVAETAAMYYAIAPDQWRRDNWEWFEAQAEIMALGPLQNACGSLNGPGTDPHSFAKQNSAGRGFGEVTDEHLVMQTFEIGLWGHALWCILKCCADGIIEPRIEDGIREMLLSGARFVAKSQVDGDARPVPDDENPPGAEQPPWYVAIGPVGEPSGYYDEPVAWGGGGEGFHGHFHLAYAWLVTRDNWFLQRLFNLAAGPGPRGERVTHAIALREGHWYGDRLQNESSGWNNMLNYVACTVGMLQRDHHRLRRSQRRR